MNEKEFISALSKARNNDRKVKSRYIILAYKSHIELALKNGFSFTDIFNLLKEENIYPYSYNAFIKIVKTIVNPSMIEMDHHNLLSKGQSNTTPKQIEDKTVDTIKSEHNSFDFNPQIKDTKELI